MLLNQLFNQRSFRVTTPLGPGRIFFEQMSGQEQLGKLFKYEVTLVSPDPTISIAQLLGQTITIEIDLPLGETRHFNGYVVAATALDTTGEHGRFHVTLHPWLALLDLTSNCRIFQNVTIPEVVMQVCRDQGFTDIRNALSGTYRSWEYLVQYRETDLNFISRLLEQEGIYYFFEHLEGKHILVLADGLSAHRTVTGYEVVPYYPGDHAGRRERDHLNSWTVDYQIRPGGLATSDYDFQRPRANLQAQLALRLPYDKTELALYDYPGEYGTAAEGEAHVRVRLEERQWDHEVVRTSGDAMGLHAGALFRLGGFPRVDQNREHLIVSAAYEIHSNAYQSGSHEEESFHGSFTVIDSRRPFRTPSTAPKPRVEGPQTATVVGKEGEEIWTDKYGRVKVQFHWDRQGQRDENSSCWVRVAQVWAGSKWGAMYVPRIGQEVIVDFLEGDPDRPIVTGRVYNGDNMPPWDLPAHQTQSGLRSHSTKGGGPDNYNEIRFEDARGAEKLSMQAERDMQTLVKHDQRLTVRHDRHLEVGAAETIHVGGPRKTTVHEKDTAILENEHEATVTGKVTQNFKAEHELTVQGPQTVTVATTKQETVEDAYDLTTKNRFNLTQGSTNVTCEGGKVTVDAGSVITLKRGPATMTMDDAGRVVIATPAGIALEVGPNKIVISASGIEVNGIQVAAIAGPSSLALTPGNAKLAGPTADVEAQSICNVKGMALLNLNSG